MSTALTLLERHGLDALSLRAIARDLDVDPMALYHYFPDKHALLRDAAALAYSQLEVRSSTRGTWQQRLEALAIAYVELLARSGELLRYLTSHDAGAARPTQLFEHQFRDATAALPLAPRDYRAAHDTFVDFLHGFSLGVRGELTSAMRRRLREQLTIVLAGLATRAGGEEPHRS